VRVWSGEDLAAAAAAARLAPKAAEADDAADFSAERALETAVPPTAAFGDRPRLLSVFSAFPENQGDAEPQLCLAYLPGLAQLAAASGRALRLWDLRASACQRLAELPSRGGAVTCLASAFPGTHILIAGTAGGAVHVLDTRSAAAVVRTFEAHAPHYVVGVAQARTGSCYSVVSGSTAAGACASGGRESDGSANFLTSAPPPFLSADLVFWDLRLDQSLRSVLAHSRGAMTGLAVHDFAPLVATGSLRQEVHVLTNSGESVDLISHHESFGSDRLAPVTCLAWHPSKPLLAVGARDSLVSLRMAL